MLTYHLISSAEPDLFQERLNRLSKSLKADQAIQETKFSTNTGADGKTLYSALVAIKNVEAWQD